MAPVNTPVVRKSAHLLQYGRVRVSEVPDVVVVAVAVVVPPPRPRLRGAVVVVVTLYEACRSLNYGPLN